MKHRIAILQASFLGLVLGYAVPCGADPVSVATTSLAPSTPTVRYKQSAPPTSEPATDSSSSQPASGASGDSIFTFPIFPIFPIGNLSEDLRKLIDAANRARAEFLKEQQAIRASAADANRELRERLRSKIRTQREAFVSQQHDLQDDLRKKLTDLRDQLKQHHDVIDSARAELKERVHARKDD